MVDEATERVRAAREKVLEAVRELDAACADAGLLPEPREGNDLITRCAVVAAWQRFGAEEERDSSQVMGYAVTLMPEWMLRGLLDAEVLYAGERLLAGDGE